MQMKHPFIIHKPTKKSIGNQIFDNSKMPIFTFSSLIVMSFGFILIGPQKTTNVSAMNRTDPGPSRVSSSQLSTAPWSSSNVFCDSDSCKSFAHNYMSRLDWNGWHCDDFYEFVCHKSKHSIPSLTKIKVQNNIEALVNSDMGSANGSRLRNLFKSCMKENPKNRRMLIDLIAKSGGFPLGGRKSGWKGNDNFDWVKTNLNFRRLGLNINQFFEFGAIELDQRYDFKIDISRKDLLVNIEDMERIVRDLYPLEDLPVQFANVARKSSIVEVIQFSENLRSIVDSAKGSSRKYDLQKLESKIPELDWSELFSGLTRTDDMFQTYQYHIVDYEKTKAMAKLLSKASPEVLANYMALSVIDNFAPYLRLTTGLSLYSPLQAPYLTSRCIDVLKTNLGLALSIEYHKRYATRATLETIRDMMSQIMNEFTLLFNEDTWFCDPETKPALESHIGSLLFDVGIPDELLDPEVSEQFYKHLELSSDNLMENLLNINMLKYDLLLRGLIGEDSQEFQWMEYDSKVSASPTLYYHEASRKIYVMSAIVDTAYIDSTRLTAINYGILGTRIALEILKAIGFNAMSQSDLDHQRTTRSLERLECFRRQYNGLRLSGADWSVNGDLTLMNNLADNVAVYAAYRGFDRWLSSNPYKPSLLRGIPLSSRELFWASYASRMCGIYTNSRDTNFLRNGATSPPKFRVNIPLSNYETFSSDFRCPLESPMNPINKCLILS